MQAIITQYKGPTNTKPSRMTASCARGKLVVPYDHALDVAQNHQAACEALCAKFVAEDTKEYPDSTKTVWGGPMIGGSLPSGDWCWVFEHKFSPVANRNK